MRPAFRTKRAKKTPISVQRSLFAPYRGLNTRDPLAGMREGYASLLVNWWPRGGKVETRAGAASHKTGFVESVKTLMVYEGLAGSPKLFAAADDGIFDATSAGAIGAAAQALTEGWVSHVQFRNSAGTYLILVNGTDNLTTYDGASWSTTASFTVGAGSGGGTKNTNLLSFIEAHQRRLWFIEEGTTDAWYQPADQLTGDLNRFRIGAQFSEGGTLLALATWSLDSGTGPEDLLAFISTKGQVAVYSGLDPSDDTAWSLRGVYKLSDPLGSRCVAKVGGDLWIATLQGVVSMTSVLKGDTQGVAPSLTDIISPTFNKAADDYRGFQGWQMQPYPTENMLLINAPTNSVGGAKQFALNIVEGAWTIFEGWDAICWARLGTEIYFGRTTSVAKGWTGFDDFGESIMSKARIAYSDFGLAGREKAWLGVRPTLTFAGDLALGVGLDVDFKGSIPYDPAGVFNYPAAVWDTDLWDSGVWGGYDSGSRDWLSPSAWPGTYAALRLRTLSSSGRVTWTLTDFLLEPAN